MGMALAGGCGSSGTSSPSTSVSSTTAATSSTAPPATTTATTRASTQTTAATQGAATCPTLAQAEAALGATFAGLVQNSIPDGGIVCEYTGGTGGNAGVTIFSHLSAAVFAGQVAHTRGNPAMPAISGIGDGAYGMTMAGRSIVNAYSNARATVVAAQAPGTLAPVEALARVALAAN